LDHREVQFIAGCREPQAALAALIDRSDLSELVRLLRDTDIAADNGETLVGDETAAI